jgi:hypothetical protein
MRRTLGGGRFGAKGIVAGTPWYMSPEQAAGTAHRINGADDLPRGYLWAAVISRTVRAIR